MDLDLLSASGGSAYGGSHRFTQIDLPTPRLRQAGTDTDPKSPLFAIRGNRCPSATDYLGQQC